MSEVLTRQAVRDQLTAFLDGKLSSQRLAGWAFDSFCDEEEELLVYEPGFEEVIAEVLDELVWVDSAPFTLEPEVASQLLRRLDNAVAESNQ